MQPFNFWLYVTNCHLQLCFVIFIISRNIFQSIIIIVFMVQLICDH
jgi:hypothetical protein